mmetsp:Transcript_90027/g.179025  ORF Transcript_90027/g.179025 Transcript_90027/m.179025 type:complete len:87 (+) Transcript_90027:880-1140(+)
MRQKENADRNHVGAFQISAEEGNHAWSISTERKPCQSAVIGPLKRTSTQINTHEKRKSTIRCKGQNPMIRVTANSTALFSRAVPFR